MDDICHKIVERATSFEEADFLKVLFKNRYSEIKNRGLPIVLFGAGSAGKLLLPLLRDSGVQPVCYCDNQIQKNPIVIDGIPIISYEKLVKEHKHSIILITTSKFAVEIKRQLLTDGFYENNIQCIDSGPLSFYTHMHTWGWSHDDIYLYQDHISSVYYLLTDKKSKELFLKKIAIFFLGAHYRSFIEFIGTFSESIAKFGFESPNDHDFVENFLYFNNDLISLINNEIYIDVGAYTGDSALQFIRACENNCLKYKKIYCFEPDPKNYVNLLKSVFKQRDICCIQKGVWSNSGKVQFESSEMITARSAKIILDKKGIEINTIKIDSMFFDVPVTLIKMDIEGAEYEAIKGAAKTIRKHKPKLVISIYHKRNDVFELPLLIHEICPEYKLYLRHFSNGYTETVLIATI